MALTRFEIDTANISKLSDRPNQNDGLSSTQLKGRFDKAGNDIKTYINDVLLEELERTTDGDSGADNIGATAVGDGTATTVQGILEEIDADVTALDGAVVHKTGNETIAGVKTFTDSPIVPAPTADTHPATKKYVDDSYASGVGAVMKTDIADNLTTDDATKVLSAKQGKALAELVSTKSSKSTIQTKTLSAVSWVGSEIPYTYTLSVTGVTPTSVQEILPTTDITADQLSVLISATIQDGGQSSNTIVLKAWGTKPTIDLPIRIILRGDM